MRLTIEVPDQKIIDAIESADIGYWARVPQGADTKRMLEGLEEAIIEDIETTDRNGDPLRYTLTGEKLRQGLQLLADKWPHHMADVLEENADAITGDVIIQCALFNDIIYG